MTFENEAKGEPLEGQSVQVEQEPERVSTTVLKAKEKPKLEIVTRKELFNRFYEECKHKSKREKKSYLIEKMRQFFRTVEQTEVFVEKNMERILRNIISKKVRFRRKAALQHFNYFVTFTYDDKIHSEESFKKKLLNTIRHLAGRKGWKYMGVWERSPNRQRLHFHGLFYIPQGTMPGELIEVKDYNFEAKTRKVTVQNTYFNKMFGRSDFEEIRSYYAVNDATNYILKYIEKTGEKITYSRGLKQYFISDIMAEDIVCYHGQEDKKLLLFDDFTCWDEGTMMGKVSAAVIKELRKSN